MSDVTTRIMLGDGDVMEVESCDPIPHDTKQELRKLGLELKRLALPYRVTLVQVGPSKHLRGKT